MHEDAFAKKFFGQKVIYARRDIFVQVKSCFIIVYLLLLFLCFK